MMLSKIRHAAREMLKLDEKDAQRLLLGPALIRRLTRLGLLDETRQSLESVLSLKLEDLFERRLQTIVFRHGLAKSIHHARVLIRQLHIQVGKQIVNVPSFLVRSDAEKHIDFAPNSPFGGGRAGRVKRRNIRMAEARQHQPAEGAPAEEDQVRPYAVLSSRDAPVGE